MRTYTILLTGGESTLPGWWAGTFDRNCGWKKQSVIPDELKRSLLHIGNYAKTAGLPGGRKFYYTLRSRYYFPFMYIYFHAVTKSCTEFAREWVKYRKNMTKMKFFSYCTVRVGGIRHIGRVNSKKERKPSSIGHLRFFYQYEQDGTAKTYNCDSCSPLFRTPFLFQLQTAWKIAFQEWELIHGTTLHWNFVE